MILKMLRYVRKEKVVEVAATPNPFQQTLVLMHKRAQRMQGIFLKIATLLRQKQILYPLPLMEMNME